MSGRLLNVSDLVVGFPCHGATELRAVDRVSLELGRGESLGLVGESGSGKSATALALIGLVPPPGRVTGRVRFAERELLGLPASELRLVRGRQIGIVFQEPMTALNPVLTIGEQVAEVVRCHRGASRADAWQRAREVLELVRLPAAAERMTSYPHQLSGGLRQRVMIAIALCCEPALLIADEPTTALDATIEAQLLELLAELQRRLELAVLLISHDLSLVGRLCQRVAVMYAGEVVEAGPAEQVLSAPAHPYTQALLDARPDPARPRQPLAELPPVDGEEPRRAPGCRFAARCPRAEEDCRAAPVASRPGAAGQSGFAVRCLHPIDARQGGDGRQGGGRAAGGHSGREGERA